jgi:colicin import membrane protein
VTGTQEISIQLGGLRRRELRRLFAISVTVHLVLIAVFGFSPKSRISVPRGVIAVELVSAPAAARSAAPAAVAKPAPPKPKKVVLPAEPTTPKMQPKVVEKPPPVQPTAAPETEYEDVLARLRAESGEDAPPTEIAKAAPTAIGSPGSPDGVAISPEVAAWLKRAKIHVRKNWVVPPGFRTQVLEARVEVDLDASGKVRGNPRLSRRSGNPWYDEGVIRAIQKSSPLPPPPEAGKWNFVFMPEDSY